MNRGSQFVQDFPPYDSMAFNEAPIHESGKSRPGAARQGERGFPSMRPRFMNRGSEERGADRHPPHRAFNEAPIHESGK